MKTTDDLVARERNIKLNDSVAVGAYILGMPLGLLDMTETDVEEWMKWHDRWETMDKGTQDSYLILLALKGD